jgi:hypothetical protein
MELGLSDVPIDGDPAKTKAKNPNNREQTERLGKAKRAASACPRRSGLVQKQGDLQSLGKGLGSENGAPPGNRNDASRQHLGGMYTGGSGGGCLGRNNVEFGGGVFASRFPRCPRHQSANRPYSHSRSPHSPPSSSRSPPPHPPFFSCKRMKMGGEFALLDFPVEIICHILSFVSYRDLIRSTSVCHSEPLWGIPTNDR